MGTQPIQGPKPLPCGGHNEPACAPEPAVVTADGQPAYTLEQMQAHGALNYEKGIADAKETA